MMGHSNLFMLKFICINYYRTSLKGNPVRFIQRIFVEKKIVPKSPDFTEKISEIAIFMQWVVIDSRKPKYSTILKIFYFPF
jgi:hypothetical protein